MFTDAEIKNLADIDDMEDRIYEHFHTMPTRNWHVIRHDLVRLYGGYMEQEIAEGSVLATLFHAALGAAVEKTLEAVMAALGLRGDPLDLLWALRTGGWTPPVPGDVDPPPI